MTGTSAYPEALKRDERSSATAAYDVVVVGAGFGGMYALHRLRALGVSVHGFETGEGPGGTWYWNRYPGARVDIESMVYSYSFDERLQQEWEWPEHFSPQPDLERYANHVADRFGLRSHVDFGTTVEHMRFDEACERWHLHTSRGGHVVARYVVAATGSLHAANYPDIPGRGVFQGEQYHAARWPRDGVDLAGRRVAVIGTGSTGIQVIPIVAEQAHHLMVFQRTANFSLPSRNRPMDPDYERQYKANYRTYREMMRKTATAAVLLGHQSRSVFDVADEEREQILEQAWNSRSGFRLMGCFSDIRTDLRANQIVADFVRNKIRQIVHDPETAEKLCPKGYPLGAKRLCLDTGYFETFNRDNVDLVDLRSEPIVTLTEHALRTAKGEFPLDVIIYATGFDAMTGALTRIDVTGRGGRQLAEHWREGPRSYLGFVIAGFPNLFMIHGPGSPSVLAQMIMAGEWQAEWIADLVAHVGRSGLRCVDTTTDAEDDWAAQVAAAAEHTLYPLADSWYVGANIPGKPRVFGIYVGGFDKYVAACQAAAERGYEGFVLS
jgi:cation diffusion facilitator CzcD-associated flavoprotein CzcO